MTPEENQYYQDLKNDPTLNDYLFDRLFSVINGDIVAKKGVAFRLMTGGIPYVYSSFADNNVFSNVFPDMSNPQTASEQVTTDRSFDEISIFKDSPFGQYWEKNLPDWALANFGPAKIIPLDKLKFIDSTQTISQTEAAKFNLLTGGKINPYKYTIYIYTDGEKVIQDYKASEMPAENEVIIFMELDDGKFNFGKVVRVKLGLGVVKDLKDKFFEIDLDSDELASDIIKKIPFSKDPDAPKTITDINDSSDFNKLLIRAIDYEYNNMKFDDMSIFMLVLNGLDFFKFKSLIWLSDLSKWLRDSKYEEEKYWNGNFTSKYEPPFLPSSFLKKSKEEKQQLIKENLYRPVSFLDEFTKSQFKENNFLTTIVGSGVAIFKTDLHEKISLYEARINVLIEGAEKLEILIKHLNAFMVGLWNGILEFIATIIDLAGLIIMDMKQELGFRVTDLLWEKVENFYNFVYYDTLNFFERLLHKFLNLLYDYAYWQPNSYKIVKTIGELVPDIVAIALTWLKGAKLAEVGLAAEELTAKESIAKLEKESIQELSEKTGKEADDHLDDVINELTKRSPKIVIGNYCKRSFDINNCGGEILDLKWENTEIIKDGIETVKIHLNRFEDVAANKKMIERLEKIETGEISVTDWDKRFYTHEIREYKRYKEIGVNDGFDPGYDVWNNAHSATLEDFKIADYNSSNQSNLYHPNIKPEDF